MLISAPNRWQKTQQPDEQAPNKHRTSTEQVSNMLEVPNESVMRLIEVIGSEQKSVKEMLSDLHLKHRPTFLENYLYPAVNNGYVNLLYPTSPKHPRQKYKLTVKGLAIWNEYQQKK